MPFIKAVSSTCKKATAARFSTTGGSNPKTSHLIINAAGLDRLGIVSDVTGLVIAHGGNVGESVAGRLSSTYFSLMMLVSVPDENRDALQQDILSVPDLRSAVFAIDPTGAAASKATPTIGCKSFIDNYLILCLASLTNTHLP
jgi:predicted amino acid-binding ACT domain protein